MDKVLIELYIPAIGERFDVFVPNFLTMGSLRKLLGKSVEELSDRRYVSSGKEIICDYRNHIIFSDEKCLKDYKVQNGAKLMMS